MMAKKPDVLVMTDGELFGVDSAKLDRVRAGLRVVPYIEIDGVKCTTCQIDEEALGLTKFIAGWNETGYYVRPGITVNELKTFMKSIDWLRVTRVKSNFDMRAAGYMVIRDSDCWFVTEVRYCRLLGFCSRNYTEEQFEHEMQIAINQCKRNGQRPTSVSGSLEESH